MLTGAQIKQARCRIGWSQQDLAKKAHVSEAAVRRAESSSGEPMVTLEHQRRIRDTLHAKGILH
jgi:ribosome-binding protein aMBF1 (putative translation factor)